MRDHSHLNALEFRLHNEEMRFCNYKTPEERELRGVWVAGIKREIAQERKFHGLPAIDYDLDNDEMTIDDILAELED